jgi:hypothetical protein
MGSDQARMVGAAHGAGACDDANWWRSWGPGSEAHMSDGVTLRGERPNWPIQSMNAAIKGTK